MSKHDRISALKRSYIDLFKDLSLLASLYLAHFIVWRTVRVRHKERAARLKRLKLIDGKRQSSGVNKELMPARIDEKGILRGRTGPASDIAGRNAL